MIREKSPYEDIPSLYDMNVRAVTRPAAPKRFGAEVFENGTRDSQMIPMDCPSICGEVYRNVFTELWIVKAA
jgi:hypothetical protein